MIELPRAFKEEMKALLGEEYPAYLSTYERPVRQGFRLNSRKLTKEKWESIDPFGGRGFPGQKTDIILKMNGGRRRASALPDTPIIMQGFITYRNPAQ